MTRIICVSSGKGGVGKTTVVANLGLALTEMGYRTIVVDANLTTPNLGFHLGVPLYPKNLHDVLRGKAYVDEATFTHPSGLKIIPAGISIDDLKNAKVEKLSQVAAELVGQNDVVILDGAAGLGKEPLAGMAAADEALIVTNPNLPAVTDALKAVKVAEEMGTKVLGVVLNKVKGHGSELTVEDVEALVGYPVISQIGYDEKVEIALATKTPIVAFAPNSRSAWAFKALAGKVVGVDVSMPSARFSVFNRLFGFLKK